MIGLVKWATFDQHDEVVSHSQTAFSVFICGGGKGSIIDFSGKAT